MPSRRFVQKGSFGSHFDELVTRFPEREPRQQRAEKPKTAPKRKAKSDPHTLLFNRAWEVAPAKRRPN